MVARHQDAHVKLNLHFSHLPSQRAVLEFRRRRQVDQWQEHPLRRMRIRAKQKNSKYGAQRGA